MATYNITAPDGSKFKITAPDTATEQEVMAYAQKSMGQSKPSPESQTPISPEPALTPSVKPSFWEQHPTGAGFLKAGIEIPAMAIGAIGGAAAGAPTGFLASPVTGAIGAGLVYGAAKALERGIGLERPITTIKEAITTPIKEVGEGITLESGGVLAGKVLAPVAGKIGGKVLAPVAGKIGGKVKDIFAPPAKRLQRSIEKTVEEGIHKAIKPSLTSVGQTSAQQKLYNKKATTAVVDMIGNKNNLLLTTAEGEVGAGLPESIAQFDEAIPQTLKIAFAKSDALAKAAGGKGIIIDVSPLLKELEVIANKSNLKAVKPEITEYASKKMQDFAQKTTFTPEEAQESIAVLNKSLSAFYAKPSYGTAIPAHIDALVANNIRKSLDTAIGKATGANYQELKNIYGSIKAIEKDVAKRKLALANKDTRGMVQNLADMISGHQAVSGLVRFDPATLAAAGTVKGLEKWLRYLRNPDRMIKKMFTDTERLMEKLKQIPTIKEGVKKALEPSYATYKKGGVMKALPPPRPEPYITGEGFAMRSGSAPPITQAEHLPYQAVPVKAKTTLRNAIRKGWTAVKGDKTPLLIVDKQGRQVAYNEAEGKFLPVERPYSAYQLGKMKDVTSGLYGLGGMEGEAMPSLKTTTKGLYSK